MLANNEKFIVVNGNSLKLIPNLDPSIFDCIITSPPYNTARVLQNDRAFKNHENRYDIFLDNKTDAEYIDWSIELFNLYNKVLKPNCVVAYNISYSSEKPDLIWRVINAIIEQTNFTTVDTIVWKKKSALPNNTSTNRLTRICEFVFIFARKTETQTFFMNKKQTGSEVSNRRAYFECEYNFIEAPNNDGSNHLNKATFSSKLVRFLLALYTKENDLVFDSFSGTGTTGVACMTMKRRYFGIELSAEQVKYSIANIKRANLDFAVIPQSTKELKDTPLFD